MGVRVEFKMGEFAYVVEEQTATYQTPQGEHQIKVRVVAFHDEKRDLLVVVPLPADPPPSGLAEGKQPPALDLAQRLNGSQVVVAHSIPKPPPGRLN